MFINIKDHELLKELGKQVAEVAALPRQEETRKLWKSLNALKPVRPMVMIDQIPWQEMNVDDELTLKCENDFCRILEWKLREILYRWKHMRADMVVEKFIDVEKVINNICFGLPNIENTAVSDPQNPVIGHSYFDQLKTEDDLEKIKTPEISLDKKATDLREEIAREIFDGILGIRMTGASTMFNLWDWIVQWHGVENTIFDLVDRPEFMHKLMSRLTAAYFSMLEQYEQQGLLAYDMPTIHCSGAYTDELPAPGFNPSFPGAKDTWTCGMAQIFATVSPAMHDEFDLEYAIKWYEKFGLVYYGCCEPLHSKIDIIRKIPHLRKISISPWADQEKASGKIGPDFVFSRKPSPAFLAGDTWDRDIVKKDLMDTIAKCARYGCPLEFILKDISTVRYQPQRLWEWADIAMKIRL